MMEMFAMGAQSDQVAGKAKQAAGIVTGNEDLEAEGKAERRSGDAKEKVEHAKSKVEDALDTADGKLESVVDKAKDSLHRHS
jgi:uncharacterized protein YjbJ (UPF0337 family)